MKVFQPYIDKFFEKITYDIGIDLGTANTLVVLKGEGIVINESSVVAINKNTGEVLAVGSEAKHMIGRTPAHVVSINPLKDGVIADFDSTEAMIRYFIKQVHKKFGKKFQFAKPRIVVGVPSNITEVEMRAVNDAAISAGARKVYIIEEPVAAAIGTRLPIEKATGNMVIDIGGGTTDIAIISMGGIVVDNTIKIAGDSIDFEINNYIKNKYNLMIGSAMAESVKIKIGSLQYEKNKVMEIKGRDMLSGLPRSCEILSIEVREAIVPILDKIIEATKESIEKVPPEILTDLLGRGILLTGGGAKLPGITQYFENRLNIPIIIVDEPLYTVARGIELLLDEIDLLERVKFKMDII